MRGGLVGGVCFILPGLILILALAALFLGAHPPLWIRGAAMGAGAAVPAVALRTATQLGLASVARVRRRRFAVVRWSLYAALGAVATVLVPTFLVIVIVACGAVEIVFTSTANSSGKRLGVMVTSAVVHVSALGTIGALAWVAFKVGALSYGGGFVIVPLMQHDVVTTYHWMSGSRFLDAVVLGQVTPGPVVLTVSAVGYAAKGIAGALLATLIAFSPSFAFVLVGAGRFDALRANATVGAFLAGAGPCVIGAIAGSSIPLGLLLQRLWQVPVLVGAALWLLLARRSSLGALLLAGLAGVGVVLIQAHA